jgi:hypothetical protein
MITCQKCMHENPLGTVFCHSCGTRLVVNLADVERSVIGLRKATSDERVLRAGVSGLTLSLFLTITALILSYTMVPAMPPLELPSPVIGAAFPAETPPWAAAVAAAAAAGQGAKGANGEAPAKLGERLSWRRSQASYLLTSLGVDLAKVREWQDELVASQLADGSWASGDALAGTALDALALQAAPLAMSSERAAARARDYLRAHSENLSQQPSLTRTLVALALFDAEELSDAMRAALSVYLVDGAAPVWQAYLLPLYRPEQCPGSYPALSAALQLGVASDFFALMSGAAPGSELARYVIVPTSSEERVLWAFTAWANPVSPKHLADFMGKFSQLPPALVSSELSKACGARAATAVALLTVGAPLHVPPLWLNRQR